MELNFNNLLVESVPFVINQGEQCFYWDVPLHIAYQSPWWKDCSTDLERLPIPIDCSPTAFQQLLTLLETGDWSGVTELEAVHQVAEQNQLLLPDQLLLCTDLPDLLDVLYKADTEELQTHLDNPDLEIKAGVNALITANQIEALIRENKDLSNMQGILNTTPKHPLLDRRLKELSEQVWAERRDLAAEFFKILGQY